MVLGAFLFSVSGYSVPCFVCGVPYFFRVVFIGAC